MEGRQTFIPTPGRRYQETHPWITFRVDLRQATAEFWMLLGEARSKVEHIAGALLNPEVAREMHRAFLAKGVLATTAIEGNTLSEEEARRRIEGQLDLPPSQEYLGREIDSIIAAFNQIEDELIAGVAPPMSRATIETYNRLILDGLELEEGVVAGEISLIPSGSGDTRALPERTARSCSTRSRVG